MNHIDGETLRMAREDKRTKSKQIKDHNKYNQQLKVKTLKNKGKQPQLSVVTQTRGCLKFGKKMKIMFAIGAINMSILQKEGPNL